MKGVCLKEAMRLTGFTRRQIRYLENQGHLGFVLVSNGRTLYTAEQVELLQHIARLRWLSVPINEAAAIAHELLGGQAQSSGRRVDALITGALAAIERNARVARDLAGLRERRSAAGVAIP